MNSPIRVLHIFGVLDKGGAESRTMDIYRNIDRTRIQFDFAVHTANPGFFEEEIRALGGKVFHGFNRYKAVNLFTSYQQWSTFFKKNPYRCIHIYATNSALPILMAAKDCEIPVRISHARTAGTANILRRAVILASRPLLRRLSTNCLAVSVKAGKFVFYKNYQVIPNGIPTSVYRFAPAVREEKRNALGLQNLYVLGHIGRFEKVKNHTFLLNVFFRLLTIMPEARLVFAGDGPLRPELERQAEELGLKEKVFFLGLRNDVPALLQMFDLFVLPSLYEGMPGAALEAQAAGVDCLLSDTVTREAAVLSDLVRFLPIDKGTDIWIKEIENCQKKRTQRRDRSKELQQAGFDIFDIAKKYENFYRNECTKLP